MLPQNPAMSSPNARIRAVLFDADGVVQRTKPGWLDELGRLCGNPKDVENFIQEVFKAEEPCLLGEGDFEVLLSSVLQRWGSPVSVEEALRVWTMIDPDDAVLGLIRKLRASGTRVALATNQQPHRAEFMLNNLGYAEEFDHILCSCFIGYAKPGVEYFQKSVSILGLPAGELLFIDDHDKNVATARAAGLQSHRFHLDDGVEALHGILKRYDLMLP